MGRLNGEVTLVASSGSLVMKPRVASHRSQAGRPTIETTASAGRLMHYAAVRGVILGMRGPGWGSESSRRCGQMNVCTCVSALGRRYGGCEHDAFLCTILAAVANRLQSRIHAPVSCCECGEGPLFKVYMRPTGRIAGFHSYAACPGMY